MRNWLQRKKVEPMNVMPGDTVILTYTSPEGVVTNLLTQLFTKAHVVDEVGMFTDQTEDNKNMICGAFILK